MQSEKAVARAVSIAWSSWCWRACQSGRTCLQPHYSVADGSGLLDKAMAAVKKALAAKAV
jgi:hypothetical protein